MTWRWQREWDELLLKGEPYPFWSSCWRWSPRDGCQGDARACLAGSLDSKHWRSCVWRLKRKKIVMNYNTGQSCWVKVLSRYVYEHKYNRMGKNLLQSKSFKFIFLLPIKHAKKKKSQNKDNQSQSNPEWHIISIENPNIGWCRRFINS